MKVTFPHLGSLSLVLSGLFADLGLEVIPPPPISKRTIDLGVLHAPEFACLPLKINLGNFIEALELGADTIVMGGGTGPCRFGYYAQVQREILQDLGFKFQMIVLEPPQGQLSELVDKLMLLCGDKRPLQILQAVYTAWCKIKALDKLHREVLRHRAFEEEKGATTKAYEKGLSYLQQARTPAEVRAGLRKALALLTQVKQKEKKDALRVGLIGEVYMLLEPYANLQVEKLLGEMGVVVERSVYLSAWIKEHLILSSMRLPGGLATKRAADKYIKYFVGGHGRETVGDMVRYARRGFDGVIHILPFTCTPEIVAQSILPVVSRQEGIPYLSLSLDEQSGEAGLITRLEAFLDLLQQRRRKSLSRAFKFATS